MRLVCISDLHGLHLKWYRHIGAMPAGDVLIVAGDITMFGKLEELQSFNDWIAMLKRVYGYKAAIVIAGNHDQCLAENHPSTIQRDFLKDCVYLQDNEFVFDGIKFYGSPWTPTFGSWWFMKDEEELVDIWKTIPEDTNVLITHGPPRGILDITLYQNIAGSHALKERASKLSNLRAHIFGHIHEAKGVYKVIGGTFCNASAVTFSLNPTNEAQVVEI